jgi:hypothetical protein
MNQLLSFADHPEQSYEWLLCIRFLPDDLRQHLGRNGQSRTSLQMTVFASKPTHRLFLQWGRSRP